MKPWREDKSGAAALASIVLHVAVLAWALVPQARETAPPVARTITVALLDAPVPVVATLAPRPPRRERAAQRVAATQPPASPPPARAAESPVREAPAATDAEPRESALAVVVDARQGQAREHVAAAASTGAGPAVSLPVAAPARTGVTVLERPLPDYPSMSRRLRETGRVLVEIVVGVDGRAQSASVVESSGHERLDAAATAAVLRWRFEPAREAGMAVVARVRVPVAFELGGGASLAAASS